MTRIGGSQKERGRQAQIWTEDGEFELVGMEPGELRVGAMDPEGLFESDWAAVNLVEGRATESLVLVLRAKVALDIRLVSSSGPVGGASVDALVQDGKSVRGLTGVDGTLSLDVPEGAAGSLLVQSPGFGLALAPFHLGDTVASRSPIIIGLTQESGYLSLSNAQYDVFSEGSLISQAGGVVSLRLLASLAPGAVRFGSSITLGPLPPGEYEVCTARGDCWRGTVQAGIVSDLDLSETSR